jgi:predicted nucleic acid-binding protein
LNFLLDTNVISEARRGSVEAVAWLAPVTPEWLFISVLTLGEIQRGVLKLGRRDPAGARRLAEWAAVIKSDFGNRILPVTDEIALTWGRLPLSRTIGVADTLIAATAIVHDLTLVTRNVRDFEECGVGLVDPWAQI